MQDSSCVVLDEVAINEVPITAKEYENILTIQQEMLSLVTQGESSINVLNKICSLAEEMLPNAAASLMLKNEITGLLSVRAAPSITQGCWDALNGLKPGPHGGSCGNAVYLGKSQFVQNTFKDARWTNIRSVAFDFNICSCWSTPVKDELGNTVGSFALSSFEHRSPSAFHKKLLETGAMIISIVLKNEAHKKQLEKMTHEDSLTHLKNKTLLQKELETNDYCTLIFLDINNFSYINTAYGFEIADKVLVQVASVLNKIFAKNLYRINADQFALKFNEKVDINKIVHLIQNTFSETLISTQEVTLKISFTYGAIYSNKDLLKHVTFAMKKAKLSGKNKLYTFNEDIDNSKQRDSFISVNNFIYHAFEADEIVPYFQGIYDNNQKKITKYEALVRIVTSDNQVHSPFTFLEVAKLSGLLPKLTKIMIEKTFAIRRNNSYDFSINITEDDLNSNYIKKYLDEKSLQYKIKPYRVTLEILEDISSSGQKNNIKQLKKLKYAGYKLAIDDFGAEYSNFERVLDLDVDFIKIDAKYIKNIDTDKKSYEIVKAIVNFANNISITVIAEFVHSASVKKIVEELGITYSQGYYFSEPTPTLQTTPLNS